MGAVRHFHDDEDTDDIGFAVGAGLSLGIPGGWSLDAQGGYAEGALRYVTTDPHPDGSVGDWDDGEDANQAWSVRAGINGPLFASLNAWLDGSYTDVQEDDDGDSYEFWAAKAGAAWTPTPGLVMGPEVAFNHFEEDDVADTSDSEYDVWGVMWRVQRSF
jgi:opacity protein-like surface antigen